MDSPVGSGPSKSIAKSLHGPVGKGVVLIGSGGGVRLTNWHPWQVLQCFSASLSMPGHHTLLQSVCLVPTMPKWPSWAMDNTLGLSFFGMTILVPLSISFPIVHSSPPLISDWKESSVSAALPASHLGLWEVVLLDASVSQRHWRLPGIYLAGFHQWFANLL